MSAGCFASAMNYFKLDRPNEYEQDRIDRIAANKKKLAELGIVEAWESRSRPVLPKAARKKRPLPPPRVSYPRKSKSNALEGIDACLQDELKPLHILLGLPKYTSLGAMPKEMSVKAQWLAFLSKLDLIVHAGIAEDLAELYVEAGLKPGRLAEMGSSAIDLTYEVVSSRIAEHKSAKFLEAAMRTALKNLSKSSVLAIVMHDPCVL